MVLIKVKKKQKNIIRADWFWILVLLVCVTPYIKKTLNNKLPIFNNIQAASFYYKNYPRMLVRYQQSKNNFNDYLSIGRRAVKESLYGNTINYFNNSKLPSININIDFEDFQKIKAERKKMLGKIFMAPTKTYYKASIQHNGKNIPIKLRLKGERTDHINDPKKWSYRIKTRKGKSIFGIREFSIQHPITRSYQLEAMYHELAKKIGLLSLKFFFVNVAINGENLGIMALEEHFGKELMENNQRKESHILQLDDYNVQKLYHRTIESILKSNPNVNDEIYRKKAGTIFKKGNFARLQRIYYNALSAPVKSYTASSGNEYLQNLENASIGLLEGVISGKLKPSEVFNVDQMGKFFAYLTLWGSAHNASFRNLRLYFNPYTFKFEPIAFDSNAYATHVSPFSEIATDKTVRDHELSRILLSDNKIMGVYKSWIKKLYKLVNSKEFFIWFYNTEKKYLDVLRKEYWFLPNMNVGRFFIEIGEAYFKIPKNSYFISQEEHKNTKKDPNPLVIPKHFDAPEIIRAKKVNDKIFFYNLFPLKAKIISLNFIKENKEINCLQEELPITLKPFYYNEFRSYEEYSLRRECLNQNLKIKGIVKVETQDHKNYEFTVTHGFKDKEEHDLKRTDINFLLRKYKFLKLNKETNTLEITEGNHVIEDMIILKDRLKLQISKNTILKFANDAGIIVNAALNIIGAKDKPILLTAKKDEWAGITVLNAKEVSKVENVIFAKTNFAKHNLWKLTGGINFYKSNVKLKNVIFHKTKAEDALNIIHSQFLMTNCTINGSRSDAFDGDFSTGKIINSHFENVGGDAIDFSGSKIEAINLSFLNIYDKAVSVGEGTELIANNLKVTKSGTGFAVKDGSNGTIKNSIFKDIKYSTLMAYDKKNFYGPSKLIADNITYEQKENAVLAQKGSSLILDKKDIPTVKINIDELYKVGYMKK